MRLAALVLGVAVLGAPQLAAAGGPELDGSAELRSNNGAWLLEWSTDADAAEFELQEASTPAFEVAELRYRGPLGSYFVSGRRNGSYWFRVRARAADGAWTDWSAPQQLIVEHHSLTLAWSMFALGGLVFISTCVALWLGARRSSHARSET